MNELEQTPRAGWYVVLTANGRKYSLPCEHVLELVRSEGQCVSKVPKTAEAVHGMINHRGRVLPVVELRSLLGDPSFSQEIEEMREFVKGREADHVAWLEELRECAASGRRFTKALDPKLCAFGKWYEDIRSSPEKRKALTSGNMVLEKVLGDFDAPHKRIHGIAEEVLQLASAGKLEEANRRITAAWETDLARMKYLFSQFFEAFATLRVPSVIVLSHANHNFALYVDHVEVVAHFEADQFEPAPDLTLTEKSLSEFCLRTDEGLAMVLNVPSLISTIQPASLSA